MSQCVKQSPEMKIMKRNFTENDIVNIINELQNKSPGIHLIQAESVKRCS